MMSRDEPPFVDLDLERALLGGMVRYGLYPSYLSAGISTNAFYRQTHRWVFEAITTIHRRGLVADLTLVAHELGAHRDDVGVAYLAGLGDGVVKPTLANLRESSRLLLALAAGRALDREATRFHAALRKPGVDQTALVAAHVAACQRIQQRAQTSADAYTATQQVEAYQAFLEQSATRGLWFGIHELDKVTNGLKPGDLCGIMARPGIGKTLLLCNLARYIAEFEVGHVFVSLEMPTAQVVERLMRAHYELGLHQLRERLQSKTLNTESYDRLYAHLVILDRPGLSVSEITAQVEHAALEQLDVPLEVVTIDHFGLIGGRQHKDRYERFSTIAQELQSATKRLGAAVLVTNQVSREAGGDGSRELHLGASRDSGVFEEVCDSLIGLRRLDRCLGLRFQQRLQYRDVIFAKLLKNRHGELGKETALQLDPVTLQMVEDARITIADQDDTATRKGGRR